jgi:hypothetical protein
MARKVFQDFAHVLCQKFIEVPSSADLVNLVIFGDGRLELDITTRKANHNRAPISPLSYMNEAHKWLEGRLTELLIPSQELVGAALTVDYTVTLQRKPPLNWLSAQYDFACIGVIRAHDREYTSSMKATKKWGLGQLI